MVQVTNKNNGRFITVRINDRGPFTLGRVIDFDHRRGRSAWYVRPRPGRPDCVVRAGSIDTPQMALELT